ncbi:MAG: hypothetical protein CMN57_00310 [Gammaproteobacteria bacterium]|nr:hypothetical protein [Gammaproteobacteria bacterium]
MPKDKFAIQQPAPQEKISEFKHNGIHADMTVVNSAATTDLTVNQLAVQGHGKPQRINNHKVRIWIND